MRSLSSIYIDFTFSVSLSIFLFLFLFLSFFEMRGYVFDQMINCKECDYKQGPHIPISWVMVESTVPFSGSRH